MTCEFSTARPFTIHHGESLIVHCFSISKCKAAGAKALFSLGGWTGSEHFSALLSKEDSRKALVESIKKEMATGWDGVDIDFEYPGRAGATEDFDLVNDLPNFLSLFKELREALGKEAIITTDTSAAPWLDPTTGKPSTDLKAFAEPIDFFGLMLYDVWGSGTTSGPNFVSLDSACAVCCPDC